MNSNPNLTFQIHIRLVYYYAIVIQFITVLIHKSTQFIIIIMACCFRHRFALVHPFLSVFFSSILPILLAHFFTHQYRLSNDWCYFRFGLFGDCRFVIHNVDQFWVWPEWLLSENSLLTWSFEPFKQYFDWLKPKIINSTNLECFIFFSHTRVVRIHIYEISFLLLQSIRPNRNWIKVYDANTSISSFQMWQPHNDLHSMFKFPSIDVCATIFFVYFFSASCSL